MQLMQGQENKLTSVLLNVLCDLYELITMRNLQILCVLVVEIG